MRPKGRYKNIEANVVLTYINFDVFNVSTTAVVEGSDQLKSEVLGVKVRVSDQLELNVISNSLVLDITSSRFVAMSLRVKSLQAGISRACQAKFRGQVRDQTLDITNGAYYKGF
tara:strand:- start:690 stop:1031 length:342 start_codon:yes stop_codon:yes gene_type:complete